MITTLLCLGLGLGSVPGAAAPAIPHRLEAPQDAYEALYKEYKLARRAHRTAERKARQEDRLDEFDQPAPLLAYFGRFEALAKAGNPEALLFCALEVQGMGWPKEQTQKFKQAAFERLSTEFVTHPLMAKVISKVGRQGEWLTEKQITTVLGTIAKQGKGDDVRSEASYHLARRLQALGTPFGVQRASELYAFVQKTYPESRAAKRSEQQLAGLKLAPGNVAPDFDAVDPDGNAFKLSDYRGKVVVLDFWGFWWGACVQEIPHLRALVERHKNDDFALIGINTDDDKAMYNKKAKEHKVNWRSAWEGSPGGPIPTAWQVRAYPTTVVIDRMGVIRHRDVRGKALDQAVAKLLAEKPAPDK